MAGLSCLGPANTHAPSARISCLRQPAPHNICHGPQLPTASPASLAALTSWCGPTGTWPDPCTFMTRQYSSRTSKRKVDRHSFAAPDTPALGSLPAPPSPPALLTCPEHVSHLLLQLLQHIHSATPQAPAGSSTHTRPWPPLLALHSAPVQLGSLPSGRRAVLLVLVWQQQGPGLQGGGPGVTTHSLTH